MDRDETARVDELRKQLRSLGYLDAGVDRFVLGPARSARSPLSIAALASLRVGLIAAVLLGPAVAAGIGTRLPGLVTGTRDAIVVALYLAILFGVVVSVLTFAASVTLARFSSLAARARLVSRGAGTLVAIGCLVYLTLWWRSANAGLAWSAPAWTLFAIAIAVAVSLLLGHAVAITTFAVIAARHPVAVAPGHSRSTWRMVVAAAVVAFAGASALLVLAAPASPAPAGRSQLTVVSAGVRVRVIAIDGFDPAVFRSLSSELPVLSSLLGKGRVDLEADEIPDPARSWMTIATGQPPDVHGVHGLETRRVPGVQGSVAASEERGIRRALRGATDLLRLTRPAVASGTELRAKTLWEVAAEAGLRAAVVNWWTTWPAGSGAAHEATVISDRAVLRLERGGTLDAEIAPPALYERLQKEWSAIRQESAAGVASLLPAAPDQVINAALRRSAELDALQLGLAARVQADAPDLLAVYLPGLDIAQHTLLGVRDSASPSSIAARIEGIQTYYKFLDAALKDVLQPRTGEMVIFVSQPGRLSGKFDVRGLLAMAGTGTAPEANVEARRVDVAPTVLHALGVPISRDLAGAPLLTLFARDFQERFPVRYVATYGPRTQQSTVRQGKPLDQEMIDRLRSLGYVR